MDRESGMRGKERFPDGWNVWLVKSLRQLGHNASVRWMMGIMIGAQLLLLLTGDIVSDIGRWRQPWWMMLLLALCGVGAAGMLFTQFGGWELLPGALRDRRRHFFELAPLAPGRLLLGVWLLYSFFFLVFLLSMSAALLLFCFLYPALLGEFFVWLGMAYVLPLCFYLIFDRDIPRPECVLLLLLCLVDNRDDTVALLSLPTLNPLGICCLGAYIAVCAYARLLPPVAERERLVRLGQLLLLAAAPWTGAAHDLLPKLLPTAAALGAVVSMGGSLGPMSERQLRKLPRSRLGRLAAFFTFGGSAGGWCWAFLAAAWVFRRFGFESIWCFLLGAGLLSGLFGAMVSPYLLRRSARRQDGYAREFTYYLFLFVGLLTLGGFLPALIAAVTREAVGPAMRLALFRHLWPAAALGILLQLPALARSAKHIFGTGKQ